jgi:hypothetical protein
MVHLTSPTLARRQGRRTSGNMSGLKPRYQGRLNTTKWSQEACGEMCIYFLDQVDL